MKHLMLFFVLLSAAATCRAAADSELGVVPAVQHWSPADGSRALPATITIRISTRDADALRPVAAVCREDLIALGFSTADIQTADAPTAGDIFLAIDPTVASGNRLAAQAYKLDIADAARISATTPDGIFYGTRTLLQLAKIGNGKLPCGHILDYPDYARRMLMIDVARKPFPVWVLKDFIRIISWYKMNELHLHLSDDSSTYSAFRVQSKKFPGLAAKDLSYSWQDLRDLQDFAEIRGVTITPEIDMPGHAGSLTSYWPDLRNPLLGKVQMDVTNPKTAQTMESLLDEMIPLFDAPDFHIGTDEYHTSGTKEQRQQFGESFRQFINTMNGFIRSKGKHCRIWSGFEGTPGTTLPDPSVIVDMWVTHDAKSLIAAGHNVISSSDGLTYLVPGAHYYGVSNGGIYENWEPYKISGDPSKNPDKDDPHLLGGKLHIWEDQGPAGYTLTEIADLARPSIQVFSEKLWGRKASANFREFQTRPALAIDVPGVTIFQRNPATGPDGLVFHLDGEHTLSDAQATINLPWADHPLADMEYNQQTATPNRADLEYPWTLSIKVKRTADLTTRGVILSSDLVEICANHTKATQTTETVNGKKTKTTATKVGLGITRAAGAFGKDPLDSHHARDVDAVVGEPLPLNQWVSITIVGLPRKTDFYVDGKLIGSTSNQMVCPLKRLGSADGNSFIGIIKDLNVWNVAKSDDQIRQDASERAN